MESTDDVRTMHLAATAFLRRQEGGWTASDQAELDAWLADPECAAAYNSVRRLWSVLGGGAASPEIATYREELRIRTQGFRKASPRIWTGMSVRVMAATSAAAALCVAGALAFLAGDREGTVYTTEAGEQRIIELNDRSRIALDVETRLLVRFTRDSRVIELSEGQAQFMVASDPRRPFRVDAGGNAITAVGTSFNVAYLDRHMSVAMLEGEVKVTVGIPQDPPLGASASMGATTSLVAGQELRVSPNGQAELNSDADIEAAIAWRQGKIIFEDTTLNEAIRRVNRYSRVKLVVEDPVLAQLRISGIFESGDVRAFIEAIEAYLPITVIQDGPELMKLVSAAN